MNGPEHYREAEKLIERVNRDEAYRTDSQRRDIILAAQAHATLALAAATAIDAHNRDLGWTEVAS